MFFTGQNLNRVHVIYSFNELLIFFWSITVLGKLEKDVFTVFTWFQNNCLKGYSGKFHLLTTSDNVLHINVGVNQISSSKYEELLGILGVVWKKGQHIGLKRKFECGFKIWHF